MGGANRIGALALGFVVVLNACGWSLGDGDDAEPSVDVTESTPDGDRDTPPSDDDEEEGAELSLAITDPVNGRVVDTEWYVFRGTTVPGATVLAAGDIVVPVADDGSWEIRLRLRPGMNVATIVAEDASGARVVEQVQVEFEVPGGDDPPIFSP